MSFFCVVIPSVVMPFLINVMLVHKRVMYNQALSKRFNQERSQSLTTSSQIHIESETAEPDGVRDRRKQKRRSRIGEKSLKKLNT